MVAGWLRVEGDGSALLQRALQEGQHLVNGQSSVGVPVVVLKLEADSVWGLQYHETGRGRGHPGGQWRLRGGRRNGPWLQHATASGFGKPRPTSAS